MENKFKKTSKFGVEYKLISPKEYTLIYEKEFESTSRLRKDDNGIYYQTTGLHISEKDLDESWEKVKAMHGATLASLEERERFEEYFSLYRYSYFIVKEETVPNGYYKGQMVDLYLKPIPSKLMKPETKRHFGDIADYL